MLGLALVIIAISIPFCTYATDTETLISNPFELLWNSILGILLFVTNLVVSLVGKLIVLLLGAIIIPILGYNNFGNSTVVDIGWPLVRDIVNMFVIVILIVIAVQTIVGYGQSKWEQQLPRLFLAIVLVNFSRTICLLMVDASQIVMFTFVNALRDIAAGNFMSLFQLNEFVSVNSDILDIVSAASGATGAVGAEGMSMTNLLMTSLATLSLLFMVLGTLIILTVVYLYRIILIWVLMIISPIAFFMKGLDGIVSESKKYNEWMSQFVGALTLGPILTFFLWLGLAAASSGPIAVTEGMNFEGTKDVPTLLANAFATDKFVSVLIGMILIMAGFKVASGAAGAMGNIAGKLVTEDAGKKMFKGALTMPGSYAYRGARGAAKGAMWAGGKAGGLAVAAGKRAGVEVGRQFAGTEFGKSFTKEGTGILSGIGKAFIKDGGFVGSRVGGAFIGASDRFRAGMDSPNAEGRAKAKEKTAGESEEAAAAHLSSAFNPDGSVRRGASLADMRANEQRIIRAMTDKKFRKTLKGQMSAGDYDTFMKNAMAHVDKNKDDLLDESQAKEFTKTKNGNLRYHVDNLRRSGKSDAEVQTELDEMISDDDFKVSQLSEEDVKDETIRKALGGKTVRTWTDPSGVEHKESMLDQVRAGRGVEAAVQKGANELHIDSTDVSELADAIARAVSRGEVDPNTIGAGNVTDPARAQEIARGLARSGFDVNTVADPATRAAIETGLDTASRRTDISRNERAGINQARVNAGVDVNNVFNITPAGGVTADMASEIRNAIANHPSMVGKFDAHLTQAATTGANDVSRAVTDAIGQVDFKDLAKQFNSAQNDAQRNEIRNVMDQYEKALQAESARAGNTGARNAELQRHQRQVDLARNQM